MTLYDAVHLWLRRRVDEIAPTSFDKEARLAGWLLETSFAHRELSSFTGDDLEQLRHEIDVPGNRGNRGKGSLKITMGLFMSIVDEHRDIPEGEFVSPWVEGIRQLPINRRSALGMRAMLGRGMGINDVAERYGATPEKVAQAVRRLERDIAEDMAAAG